MVLLAGLLPIFLAMPVSGIGIHLMFKGCHKENVTTAAGPRDLPYKVNDIDAYKTNEKCVDACAKLY